QTANPAGNTVTSGKYASNVTTGNLVAVDNTGAAIAGASTAAPADTFDPNHSYFGLFDPFRCYTTNSNSFTYGSIKINTFDVCAGTFWDGKDRKSTRLNSSHDQISYAVFCLKKKNN